MSEFEKMLEKVKELGGTDDFITELRAERTAKNESDKNKRKTNTDILNKVMSAFDIDDKSQVVDKVTTTSNEVKMLMKKIEEANQKTEELSQSVLAKEEETKIAKRSGLITDLLASKGIKSNDVIKAGLLNLVEDGTSGLLVGDKSLEDYIQAEFIDGVETVTKNKLKVETKEKGDLFSSDELDKLTEKEMSDPKIMDKVDASMEALG